MVTTRSSAAAQARSRSGTPATTQPTPAAAKTTIPSIDPATKKRTIAHMNKDHTDDMSAILQHYSHLSVSQADGAEMLDLDLISMTIRSASGTHTVPVTPPMDTWDDRRARLVAMTTDARKALGLDENDHASVPTAVPAAEETSTSSGPRAQPTAPRYVSPQGTDWISFAGVSFYFLCAGLVYGGLVTPDSPAWRALEAVRFPQGPVGFIWLVEALFLPVLAIHVAEAWWMDRSRLAPAGVARGSRVWLLWVGNAFLEGVPAYKRWDRVVKAKAD